MRRTEETSTSATVALLILTFGLSISSHKGISSGRLYSSSGLAGSAGVRRSFIG